MTDYVLSGELPRRSPESQGIASAAVLAFMDELATNANSMHSIMLLRHGAVVAEGWWKPYKASRPHMLFSLSKSFTSTAVGFARAEGLLSLDDHVTSFFPEETPAEISENLAAMRVRHLLSMSTGHSEDTLGRLFRESSRCWAEAFLKQPVEHAPGTHFVYNSGATYMLSAIVQKVAGVTLLEYLQPRLLAPLGISGATWETCPQGVNTGGWGLSIRTEDIANFGQLYLQDGVWNGAQLLPAGWVEEATSKHISNGDDPNSDWAQGYGFQFWRSRHGAYRGDGAFGQFCVVMQEQDAVLVTTAGIGDMQFVLNAAWKHLLPAMRAEPVAEDAAQQDALAARLDSLWIRPPAGSVSSPMSRQITGRTYLLEPNEHNLKQIIFNFGDDSFDVLLTDANTEHVITCGRKLWLSGRGIFDGNAAVPLSVAAAWTDNSTLTLKACATEAPFILTVICHFDGERVTIDRTMNVAFGPREWKQLVGSVQPV